jgi:hypothetical protein
MYTGEGAEELVEDMPSIGKNNSWAWRAGWRPHYSVICDWNFSLLSLYTSVKRTNLLK